MLDEMFASLTMAEHLGHCLTREVYQLFRGGWAAIELVAQWH